MPRSRATPAVRRHPGQAIAPPAPAPAPVEALRLRRDEPDAGGAPLITVRALRATDAPAELTALLHRAYRPQVEMGLRPLAGRQSEDVTRDRVHSGECFVATAPDGPQGAERIVGMILLQEKEAAAFPPTFQRAGVTHFSLFAVEPDMQGRGIGHALLDAVIARSRELGAREIALSMAEPDTKLLRWYERQGFTIVEFWQWPYTNYRSAILSKPIA